MSLVGSTLLTKFPDVSGMPLIKMLLLDYCIQLVEVHDSVGCLKELVELSLIQCHAPELFPRTIILPSLEYMEFSGCRKLNFFPEIEEDMKSLKRLYLNRTIIKELPASFSRLSGLEELRMDDYECLTKLPDCIYKLKSLKRLGLNLCTSLVANSPNATSTFTNLSSVIMGEGVSSQVISQLLNSDMSADCICTLELPINMFSTVLVCITKFAHLVKLDLNNCQFLREIPQLPPSVVWVDISDCIVLQEFANLSDLFDRARWINLINCYKLVLIRTSSARG